MTADEVGSGFMLSEGVAEDAEADSVGTGAASELEEFVAEGVAAGVSASSVTVTVTVTY